MATYYAIQSGGTWNSASTWASSTGQTVGGAGIPTATDSVIIDSTMTGTITSDTGSDSCLTLNCTGCTGTLAFGTRAITVSGNVTFGSGMTITGTTATLTINASGTLITNGKTLPCSFTFLGANTTLTLGSNFTLTGTFTVNGTGTQIIATAGYNISAGPVVVENPLTMTGSGTVSGTTFKIDAAQITITSNWTFTGTLTNTGQGNEINGSGYYVYVGGSLSLGTQVLSGTSTLVLDGTGTWSGTSTTGLSMNIIIYTSGTITLSGTLYYGAGTFTYTAGTIVNTSSTVVFSGSTINASGMNFNNVIFGNSTITLTSNLNMTGILSNQDNGSGVSSSFIMSGAYNISCATLSIGALSNSVTCEFVAGQTITVTSALHIYGNDNFTCEVVSVTSGSATNLAYTGTYANQNVNTVQFIDVNASTSTFPIYNWQGISLTRCTNITNVNGNQIGGGCIFL